MGGRVAVSADNFYKLGGYDERIEGWGPDDLQFCLRARDAGLQPVAIPPQQVGGVITHDTESRLQELSPGARAQSEKLIKRPAPLKLAAALKRFNTRYETVANNGEVGCGEVTINFNQRQQIGPLEKAEAAHSAPERKTDWAMTTGKRGQGIERS
ncbi:MAG: hypothetical protein DI598_11950 [Pseudopedobacter saltans]|uniref:Galactosyltransferase C-terminal domain-containing protein n=1 Tax=Pseudopedobacter saltans TaxID=151895 RepID=A0A2W5ERB1_9SPHI|nr:MAG: hypothetical protein DI598_11950 [Pseudopedobacter saltans]